MSKFIADILGSSDPGFIHHISRLEQLSGKPNVDIHLHSEIIQHLKHQAEALGLDGNDTNAKELYFSLNKKALEDSKLLAKKLGINDDDSPEQMVKKCIDFVNIKISKTKVWMIKTSVARRHLKNNPPKKTMKIFGIRSIDSLLKRESITAAYVFARSNEPQLWLDKFIGAANKLSSADFDNQKITISMLKPARQKQLLKAGQKLRQTIYADNELADILITIPPGRFGGDVIFVVEALLSEINKMVMRSSFYKYRALGPNFFEVLGSIRQFGFKKALFNQEFQLSWQSTARSVQRFQNDNLLTMLEPHLSQADFQALKLHDLFEDFDMWQHDFVLSRENGTVVSSNLMDVIINSVNNSPIESSYTGYGRRSLQDELFARYLNHALVLEYVLETRSKGGRDDV